nr:hypothetical protein CFP56_46051 [Quercus suber]
MISSAMDGGVSGQRLQQRKTRKTAAEWQLPVSGLASAVADVLSGDGQGRRWCRRRWMMYSVAAVDDGSAVGGGWAAWLRAEL